MPREVSPIDSSFFSPTTDLHEWRKKVVKWVELIKSAYDSGNDSSYRTLFRTLGQTLHTRGLPREQLSIVEEVQEKGTIHYTQTNAPVAAVHEIIKVVAVDSPIVAITRRITCFNRVMSYRRKNN